MTMINSQMFYQQFLTGLQQNLQAELTDSDQISSGKKISVPSDDPFGLAQVVDYQTQISEIGQYQQAMSAANVPLQSLDTAFSNLSNTLGQANELAVQAGDGSLNAGDRLGMSYQAQQMFDTAVSTANTQVNGQYIFAGYQSTTNPIDPSTGEFISDNNSVNIGIANGINITTNISAGSLFSFKRVNTTDPTDSILPSWNSSNNGTITVPDADPTSALETGAGSQSTGTFAINNSNNTITTNVGTATIANGVYSGAGLAAALSTSAVGIGVTYNSATQKFTINSQVLPNSNNTTAAATVNASNILTTLSVAVGPIGGGITSGIVGGTTTDAAYVNSSDVFSTNGGSLNITVGGNASQSNGAFVINNNNNSINVNGVPVNIANGVYTGNDLASAINTAFSTQVPPVNLSVSYDASAHTFTLTNNNAAGGAAITADFSAITGTPAIGTMLGFSGTDVIAAGATSTSANAVGDVNLAAGSTLQNVRDAINTAYNGVTAGSINAQVVNMGSSSSPDYRLVVSGGAAAIPAGSSGSIDIKVLSTGDSGGTGVNMLSYDQTSGMNMTLGGTKITNYNYIQQGTANDSIVIDDGTDGSNVANNKIVFEETSAGGVTTTNTATIARGTYTAGQLATAIGNALTSASTNLNTYTGSYDPGSGKFTITSQAGNTDTLTLDWGNKGTTAAQVLGFNPVTEAGDTNIAAGGSAVSDNPVLDNYYSFNNNYLNDNNILRALNFETQALKNNDTGRIGQSLQYLNDLMNGPVSQYQTVVGSRENEIKAEGNYQSSSLLNVQTFLSNTDDTNIAQVSTDLSQRETALQALRTISSQVLNQSLFDFIKF